MKEVSGKAALVFGISGDQGQAVARGLLASSSYHHVYAVTRDISKDRVEAIAKSIPVSLNNDEEAGDDDIAHDSVAKHVTIIQADLNNATSIRQAFVRTRATDIFLVTTTDVPTEGAAMGSFRESEELEYDSIKSFFDVLVDVHNKEWGDEGGAAKLERHVVFSTLDNVRGLVEWLEKHKGTNAISCGEDDTNDLLNMKPLDDGGIVPHYSGKGRGGEYALSLIHGIPDPWTSSNSLKLPWTNATEPIASLIPGLTVTLITLPFLHTNFALSAVPLPANSEGRTTQWSISACLGDSSHPIDMFSVSDLRYIVPTLFEHSDKYQGRVIKLSGEKITMDEVALGFSDLFGKDIIYSPLTLEEMNLLDIPEAPAFAQLCQYLASRYADHDVEETKSILQQCGREPQSFQDWLLSHSDMEAFEKVGLTLDASPIQRVAVFDATNYQPVIKGLLADSRKQYLINACICNDVTEDDSDQTQEELEAKANEIQSLDPARITIRYYDAGNPISCMRALAGADGVFAFTNFYPTKDSQLPHDAEREDQEEWHARLIIGACAASGSVKHLVLSTMEGVDDVVNELKEDGCDSKSLFDVKARIAAYARANHISMTYLLLPVYSEQFFQALAEKIRKQEGGEEKEIINEDEDNDNDTKASEDTHKCICMSAEILGPAVANIFDSYEVFAGHEIGLLTDVLSFEEATEIINQVFLGSSSSNPQGTCADTSMSNFDYRLDIVAKDLGQMYRCYSKSDAVKHRDSIAKTLELVPDAKPFKRWLEENRDNAVFREMLGLR
mmetsp:Transcript_45106/g.94614  ORF Transcript_45106/g.94614 Transcript_45106/m.94614 type:complete len:784 (+) Transcript_45106:71-2422(+)